MSINAAPRSSFNFAASAITPGSQPASCTDIGNASARFIDRLRVFLFCLIIASLAIISDTTSPAPNFLTRRRKGKSVTPDIGARITGDNNLTGPI